MQKASSHELVLATGQGITRIEVPNLIAASGAAAGYAWEEFFLGKIRNGYTRRAYLHAVRRFLAWCQVIPVELARITPGLVGQYLDELPLSAPSKKLHLSAIRSFLDILVQRHVIVLNPALSVRAPRYSVLEGKTPEITVEQCRQLLASISIMTPMDYRDRAIIAMLIYTAARVGAIAKLRLKDLSHDGIQYSLHFSEKGGKQRAIPVRSDLERFLTEYLQVAGLTEKETPLFLSVEGKTGRLKASAMTAIDMCRMIKRRLRKSKLSTLISPHSFRACTATDLLQQGISLEDVQYLLGHSDSRVTKLYDRRHRQVTRNIVERISV